MGLLLLLLLYYYIDRLTELTYYIKLQKNEIEKALVSSNFYLPKRIMFNNSHQTRIKTRIIYNFVTFSKWM